MKKPNITKGEWEVRLLQKKPKEIIRVGIYENGVSNIADIVPNGRGKINAQAIKEVPNMIDALILAHNSLVDRIENKGLTPDQDPTVKFIKKTLKKAGVKE